MNLLQEFEGLFGEVLASAALRVIVLTNPRARDAVIDVLSEASLSGPLSSNSHFACYRELGTKDRATGAAGRLDLVLEMDDAVIGVEAKFKAEFQEGQPGKYVNTLEAHAVLLRQLRSAAVRSQVIIVAPHSRREEARQLAPDCAFVSWEKLVEAVRTDSSSQHPGLERDFASFVQARLEFLPSLERDLPHLTRSFDPKGSELQCAFLGKIYWHALGLRGGRLSRAADSCGYYLWSGNEVWFGFRPSDESPSVRGASLTLASLREFELPDPPFRRAEPHKPVILSSRGGPVTARYHWIVSVSKEWRDQAHVRDLFFAVTSVAPPGESGGAERRSDWSPDTTTIEKQEQR